MKSLLLLLVFACTSVYAEAPLDISTLPEVEIHLVQKNGDGDHYQIGDRITLYVELKPEVAIESKEFSFNVPEGGSKLVDQGWYLDPTTQFLSNNLRFVVSPIQVGRLILPTLLVLKEDKTPIARTHPWSIQVGGPEKKEGELKLLDVTPIALATKYVLLFSGLAILIFGLLFWLPYRYLKIKNLKKKIPDAPIVKKDPEYLIALNSLDALYKKYAYSEENLKPISFGISEILKEFFSQRFRVDAKESTTDEMLALLKKEALPPEGLREIQNLFSDLDLIKFTKRGNVSGFYESSYQEFKIKAQGIIQRWAAR